MNPDELEVLFALDRSREDDPARRQAITAAALRRIRARPERGFDWRWLISRPVGAMLAGTLVAGIVAGLLIEPPGEDVSAVDALLGGIEGVM